MRYCERCGASFQMLRVCPRDQTETRADIPDPLVGHVLGGRYRILERIAAGGAGQIYRAAHTRIAALFAVKVLYGDLAHDKGMRSRFQREAEAACALQSRHIVRVMDFGETPGGLPYLAMEYLEGIGLGTIIARDGALPVARALTIARQIARGLAHAHERGVVHRDLKTDNVMLVEEDDESDVVKLLDFGLARIRDDSRLTGVGQVFGSPHYMAPEQFQSTDVDARADLYSLGIILYEMLSGAPPFDGTVTELAEQHLSAAPPPLRERNRAVPQKLAQLVHRLLAKSPDDRYPSARALLTKGYPKTGAKRSRQAAPPERRAAVDDAIIDRIQQAIRTGALAYAAGDSAGRYRILRDTAEQVLRQALETDAIAVAARLSAALSRSGTMEPTAAGWELRYAFDDLIQARSIRAAAPGEDLLFSQLRVADTIAAYRYAAGHLDIVGDFYLAFARQLAGQLRRTGDHPLVCARLERAAEAAAGAGGGLPALTGLSEALQVARLGRVVVPTELATPALSLSGCPQLRDFARRIVRAIAAGAPAYNAGEPAACRRVFRQTASSILVEIGTNQACALVAARLRRALQQSEPLSDDQAVWVLRHAFDDLLSAAAGESDATAKATLQGLPSAGPETRAPDDKERRS